MKTQGMKIGGKERQTRSDKKIRVNAGLNQIDHKKLERLAFAISMPKTILAAELISLCLNNPSVIDFIQRKYGADSDRLIIPIIENGKVNY